MTRVKESRGAQAGARPTKRPYGKPRLLSYGSLADVTRANATGGKNDQAKGNNKT